jgi:hypothetical protein
VGERLGQSIESFVNGRHAVTLPRPPDRLQGTRAPALAPIGPGGSGLGGARDTSPPRLLAARAHERDRRMRAALRDARGDHRPFTYTCGDAVPDRHNRDNAHRNKKMAASLLPCEPDWTRDRLDCATHEQGRSC